MKILPVSILKVNNHQLQKSIFSNYAQRFMNSQIRSVFFNFERIYDNLDYRKVIQNHDLAKELHIKKFGQTKDLGITLYGDDYNYSISVPENGLLKLSLYKGKASKLVQSVIFYKNSNEYFHSGSFTKEKIEEIFGEILDDADVRLAMIKRKYDAIIPTPSFFEDLTSEKINHMNKIVRTVPTDLGIKNFGFIDEKSRKILQNIVVKFMDIKALFKKVPNDTTRCHVRHYYKNYDSKSSVKNIIPFKNIGPHGENLSVFYTTHKGKSYVAIGVTDKNGIETNFVISKEGMVQRNLPYRASVYGNSSKRINSIPDYLTQKEIDESNLLKYLKCIDKELSLFTNHTKKWLKNREDFKKRYVNKDIATLDCFQEILENISINFKKYKKNVVKYIPKFEDRKQFKIDNNISPEITTSTVTLKDATVEGYDLVMSYPIIPNKIATQILVMDGDKVQKSFYILDNKLLKFDIKKKSDRYIHYDRKMYFYDKKYLKKSNLGKYLEILNSRFKEINEKLDFIHSQRRRGKK